MRRHKKLQKCYRLKIGCRVCSYCLNTGNKCFFFLLWLLIRLCVLRTRCTYHNMYSCAPCLSRSGLAIQHILCSGQTLQHVLICTKSSRIKSCILVCLLLLRFGTNIITCAHVYVVFRDQALATLQFVVVRRIRD